MKKFCITGGIACGKSTFSKMMEVLSWKIIDADAIVHQLYFPGQAGHQKIVDAFGKKALNEDQTVNRTLLGQLVFNDSEKLKLLNSLIHPLVREVWQQQHSEHLLKSSDIPVVVIIPLLFECSLESYFDSVACVACSSKTQRARMETWGYDAEQIKQRIKAQWPIETKMEKSQVVIWNDGSIPNLRTQARALDALWLEKKT